MYAGNGTDAQSSCSVHEECVPMPEHRFSGGRTLDTVKGLSHRDLQVCGGLKFIPMPKNGAPASGRTRAATSVSDCR